MGECTTEKQTHPSSDRSSGYSEAHAGREETGKRGQNTISSTNRE